MIALDISVCQASGGIPSNDKHTVFFAIAHLQCMQADTHQLNKSDNPEQLCFVSDLTHLPMWRVSGSCSSKPISINRLDNKWHQTAP